MNRPKSKRQGCWLSFHTVSTKCWTEDLFIRSTTSIHILSLHYVIGRTQRTSLFFLCIGFYISVFRNYKNLKTQFLITHTAARWTSGPFDLWVDWRHLFGQPSYSHSVRVHWHLTCADVQKKRVEQKTIWAVGADRTCDVIVGNRTRNTTLSSFNSL